MMEVDGLTKRQGSKAATRDLTFLSVGLFTSSLIRDQAVTTLLGSGAMRILWLVDVAGGISGLPASDIVTYVSSSTLCFDSLTGIIDTRDVLFHPRRDGPPTVVLQQWRTREPWTVDHDSRLRHRCRSAQRGTAQDAAPMARSFRGARSFCPCFGEGGLLLLLASKHLRPLPVEPMVPSVYDAPL